MCLQETRMPATVMNPPRGYTMYHRRGHVRDGIDYGGICTLIKNNIAHTRINLNTTLQAVAVRCHLTRMYTICNVYFPPNNQITFNQIYDLMEQLPLPYLIVGDMNARSPLWGDHITNAKGKIIESVLDRMECGILNDGSATHLHLQNDSSTCIDLAICSSDIFQDFKWSVKDDLFNSDHYPIMLSNAEHSEERCPERYLLDRADWKSFEKSTICNELAEDFATAEEAVKYLTDKIISSADEHIPKSKGIMKTKQVPWWNLQLKNEITNKKRALKLYNNTKLLQDKIEYKRLRARVRYLINKSKKDSWKKYVSSINERTPINETWKKIAKITQKYKGTQKPILQTPNGVISDPTEVANYFGETLEEISRGSQDRTFLHLKNNAEKEEISFEGGEYEYYNIDFTMSELRNSLQDLKRSSPGSDNIHNEMLKRIPETTLTFLLSIYNRLWKERSLPQSWREAIVIPFEKPGKNRMSPLNYRPIALTSSLCKLLERMVNKRLVWYLEENNVYNEKQYGFRKCRSTTDVLTRIDSYIKHAF